MYCDLGQSQLTFSFVMKSRIKNNWLKLYKGKVRFNIKKIFTALRTVKQCKKLPRDVVKSILLEMFKATFDTLLSLMVWGNKNQLLQFRRIAC